MIKLYMVVLREPTETETETNTYIRYGSADVDTIKAVFEIKRKLVIVLF